MNLETSQQSTEAPMTDPMAAPEPKAKRKRKSRANPMTPILRDLKVAAQRLEKVRNGLLGMHLPDALEKVAEMTEEAHGFHLTLADAWGNQAAIRARKEVIDAYAKVGGHPSLPMNTTEASRPYRHLPRTPRLGKARGRA